jgi:hypothetical protein
MRYLVTSFIQSQLKFHFYYEQLHFSDPEAFASIYRVGSTFTKDYRFYRAFMVDESSFALIDRHKSRMRRDLLSPFFSRRAILKLEGVIQQKVPLTCN